MPEGRRMRINTIKVCNEYRNTLTDPRGRIKKIRKINDPVL